MYFMYIGCNTHACIKSNIDAYINVFARMHILDLLLLLIAPLFWEFQPQSNNAASSVAVPETMVLSVTTVPQAQVCVYIQSLLGT